MTKMINDYEIVKELGNGTGTNIFLVTKNSSDNKNYYVIKQIILIQCVIYFIYHIHTNFYLFIFKIRI